VVVKIVEIVKLLATASDIFFLKSIGESFSLKLFFLNKIFEMNIQENIKIM
jgi:hypothetical protein